MPRPGATGTTPAERMASFDKQIVRDWLAAHWDKTGTPPELPAEIVERTAERYRELLELLTVLGATGAASRRSQRTPRYRGGRHPSRARHLEE